MCCAQGLQRNCSLSPNYFLLHQQGSCLKCCAKSLCVRAPSESVQSESNHLSSNSNQTFRAVHSWISLCSNAVKIKVEGIRNHPDRAITRCLGAGSWKLRGLSPQLRCSIQTATHPGTQTQPRDQQPRPSVLTPDGHLSRAINHCWDVLFEEHFTPCFTSWQRGNHTTTLIAFAEVLDGAEPRPQR